MINPIVYTDGSCRPNPGSGGWGFISLGSERDIYVSGGEDKTTNNRMELTAIIEALLFNSKSKSITIHSDSILCINCAKGTFKRKMNLDLWKRFDDVSRDIKIIWVKVKAHSGDKYNDLVDTLAKNAIQ